MKQTGCQKSHNTLPLKKIHIYICTVHILKSYTRIGILEKIKQNRIFLGIVQGQESPSLCSLSLLIFTNTVPVERF